MSNAPDRFRAILAGEACVHPGSVFDALSARVASELGFETAILGGSSASLAVLGAPDHIVLTLTELADLVRRITRAGSPPLLVDADHGYGNALNAMRTVEELHAAGAAAATLEDTLLPRPFGAAKPALVSAAELAGKVAAAVSASPGLVVVGRTAALGVTDLDDAIARARAMEEAGAEALFFTGVTAREQVAAIRAATTRPIILGGAKPSLGTREEWARLGVRVALQGHLPIQAALEAVRATLAAQRAGLPVQGLPDPGFVRRMTREDAYDAAIRNHLS
jgi:carboxyvinyl-carboxyphosphonate phosphorylmutase